MALSKEMRSRARRPTTRPTTARSTLPAMSMVTCRRMPRRPASRTCLSCTVEARSRARSHDRRGCHRRTATRSTWTLATAAAIWTARAARTGVATANSSPLWPPTAIDCSYDGCASDSDCSGGVCDCRESPAHVTWGTQTVCLGGNCRTDSDCGHGAYCSPSPALGCGPQSWSAYYCHTPGDQCVDDADCNQGNAYCAYDTGSSRWVCSTGLCIDG